MAERENFLPTPGDPAEVGSSAGEGKPGWNRYGRVMLVRVLGKISDPADSRLLFNKT
jgi:hypothetical protein